MFYLRNKSSTKTGIADPSRRTHRVLLFTHLDPFTFSLQHHAATHHVELANRTDADARYLTWIWVSTEKDEKFHNLNVK